MRPFLALLAIVAFAFCFFTAMPAEAQAAAGTTASPAPEGDARIMLFGPRYLVALGVGVVLALAFQLLLTNLSFAAGLDLSGFSDGAEMPEDQDVDGRKFGHVMNKATNALGLWGLITATVALFFASLLAGSFGYFANAEAGAVFGLAVWAIFFLILVRLEVNVATSLLGSLFGVATSALTGAATQTRRLFEVAGGAAHGDRAARAYQGARYRLENDDEALRQKQQVRRMAYQVRATTGLNAETMREILYEMLHDPRAGVDDLVARLQLLDRAHMKEILQEHEDISEEDADAILGHYDTAREELLKNNDKTRAELQRRVERARENAIARADQTRQWMAQMAWWAFGIAVLSGAASVIGGTLAAVINTA